MTIHHAIQVLKIKTKVLGELPSHGLLYCGSLVHLLQTFSNATITKYNWLMALSTHKHRKKRKSPWCCFDLYMDKSKILIQNIYGNIKLCAPCCFPLLGLVKYFMIVIYYTISDKHYGLYWYCIVCVTLLQSGPFKLWFQLPASNNKMCYCNGFESSPEGERVLVLMYCITFIFNF